MPDQEIILICLSCKVVFRERPGRPRKCPSCGSQQSRIPDPFPLQPRPGEGKICGTCSHQGACPPEADLILWREGDETCFGYDEITQVRCFAGSLCEVAGICPFGKPHLPDKTLDETGRCFDHKPHIPGGLVVWPVPVEAELDSRREKIGISNVTKSDRQE